MMEGKFNHHEEWRGIRDHRFTYVKMQRRQAEFLFDHAADPKDLANVAEDPAFVNELNQYRSILNAELLKRKDGFHSSEWYGEHWIRDGHVVRSATRELKHDPDSGGDILNGK
jgi:arylsulfatase A-like enzyme